MSAIELAPQAASPRMESAGIRRLATALGLAVLAVPGIASIHSHIGALDGMDAARFVDLLGHVMAVLFLFAAASCTVLSLAPRHRTRGWRATASALCGSFFLISFNFLTRIELSGATGMLSSGLIVGGYLAALVTIARLGRSFSILPGARRLVTDGPYALVRHPLYFAEELAAFGLFLHYQSLEAGLILALHLLFQLDRMRQEEAVLRAAFPNYATYAARTKRLLPGIF
jgi:protein-S-isoprenylcysteine O-methyltransferase Ste14